MPRAPTTPTAAPVPSAGADRRRRGPGSSCHGLHLDDRVDGIDDATIVRGDDQAGIFRQRTSVRSASRLLALVSSAPRSVRRPAPRRAYSTGARATATRCAWPWLKRLARRDCSSARPSRASSALGARRCTRQAGATRREGEVGGDSPHRSGGRIGTPARSAGRESGHAGRRRGSRSALVDRDLARRSADAGQRHQRVDLPEPDAPRIASDCPAPPRGRATRRSPARRAPAPRLRQRGPARPRDCHSCSFFPSFRSCLGVRPECFIAFLSTARMRRIGDGWVRRKGEGRRRCCSGACWARSPCRPSRG